MRLHPVFEDFACASCLLTGKLAQWDPCDWLCVSYFVISLIKSCVSLVVKAVRTAKQELS